MTPATAKRYVIGSLVIGGTISAAGDLAGGEAPHLRILIGAVIAGTVLAMVAEGSPELAASFALLILLASTLAGGGTVAAKVTKFTGGKVTTAETIASLPETNKPTNDPAPTGGGSQRYQPS